MRLRPLIPFASRRRAHTSVPESALAFAADNLGWWLTPRMRGMTPARSREFDHRQGSRRVVRRSTFRFKRHRRHPRAALPIRDHIEEPVVDDAQTPAIVQIRRETREPGMGQRFSCQDVLHHAAALPPLSWPRRNGRAAPTTGTATRRCGRPQSARHPGDPGCAPTD